MKRFNWILITFFIMIAFVIVGYWYVQQQSNQNVQIQWMPGFGLEHKVNSSSGNQNGSRCQTTAPQCPSGTFAVGFYQPGGKYCYHCIPTSAWYVPSQGSGNTGKSWTVFPGV